MAAPHRPAAVSFFGLGLARKRGGFETAKCPGPRPGQRAQLLTRTQKQGELRPCNEGKKYSSVLSRAFGVAEGFGPADGAAAMDSPECARCNPPGRRCAAAASRGVLGEQCQNALLRGSGFSAPELRVAILRVGAVHLQTDPTWELACMLPSAQWQSVGTVSCSMCKAVRMAVQSKGQEHAGPRGR